MEKYIQLSTEQSRLLIVLLFAENEAEEYPANEMPFLSAIVEKRITAMNLPITFTRNALLAVNVFCDRPGLAVLLLMDALTKFEGQTVTVNSLCDLYPMGFYDEDTLIDIIDNQVKTKQRKWSEIY